jgi:hypothetical protein
MSEIISINDEKYQVLATKKLEGSDEYIKNAIEVLKINYNADRALKNTANGLYYFGNLIHDAKFTEESVSGLTVS